MQALTMRKPNSITVYVVRVGLQWGLGVQKSEVLISFLTGFWYWLIGCNSFLNGRSPISGSTFLKVQINFQWFYCSMLTLYLL